ncbi:MAG: hypothetical protein ACJARK_000065 [Marinobacter psychrophilus]|jgi:uncharacterized protein YjbJ (UPF0337 family)|nr:hypothetical protein MRBBS_1551 [Marinobacter sp. BSs20148]
MCEYRGKLTDDEVGEMGGRKDHFSGKVQENTAQHTGIGF